MEEEMKDFCCLGGNGDEKQPEAQEGLTVEPAYRIARQIGMRSRLETQELVKEVPCDRKLGVGGGGT